LVLFFKKEHLSSLLKVCNPELMSKRRSSACLMLPLAAAACHLVDQRDFDANAGRKPVPKVVAFPAPPAPSLVTIRYTVPDPDYRQAVTRVVQQALARKRDALFMVTTRVPASGTIAAQAEAAERAAASGREVAQAIVDAGAVPGQVAQTLRMDPATTTREVIVTVR
jgi:hypothetical protein